MLVGTVRLFLSFVSGSGSFPFIDEGLHDSSEEYVLLNMDLEVECGILSESRNEAVSCKKSCCRRDFMNFRYESFPRRKSVDISVRFTGAPFDSLHSIGHLQS